MYTNNTNLPLSLGVWLATHEYKAHNSNTISATGLLRPTRQVVLTKRIPEASVDISGLVSSRMGTAIHDSIEKSWKSPVEALRALGYPEGMVSRVRVNAAPSTLTEDDIPIYMEIRTKRVLDGWNISGQFDFVSEGQLEDFKSTGTFSYINQSNKEKYALQGSIYRWLNPGIITQDTIQINYIFTDWSAIKAAQNKEYPQSRILTQKIPLLSLMETEQFIRGKLKAISKLIDSPQEDMPLCTEDELWASPDTYKYYKKPGSVRSTKNFDNYYEAHNRFIEDGSVGEIKKVGGEVKACRYCPAVSICTQAKQLISDGRLIV